MLCSNKDYDDCYIDLHKNSAALASIASIINVPTKWHFTLLLAYSSNTVESVEQYVELYNAVFIAIDCFTTIAPIGIGHESI